MFEFTRIRNLYDVVSNPKRYRNPEDSEVNLEETADPNSWRDETRATWRERLASRKRQALLFGYFGFVFIGLFAFYSPQYFPELTGNPLLIEGIKWAIIVPTTFWVGTRAIRSKLESVDWLILMIPEQGVGFYVGSRGEDTEGNATFEALKGFSIMGLRGHKLTLGDLADDWARQWAKQNRDSDDPATIRLQEALVQDRETFIGHISCVLTGGLELDEFGRETDLYTVEPPLIDPEKYRDLTTTLGDMKRKIKHLETEIDALKDDRDQWKERAMQTRREVREEIVDTHGGLAEAGFAPRQQARAPATTEGEAIMNGSGGDE